MDELCWYPRNGWIVNDYLFEALQVMASRCERHLQPDTDVCYGRPFPDCSLSESIRCHSQIYERFDGSFQRCIRRSGHQDDHSTGCLEWSNLEALVEGGDL